MRVSQTSQFKKDIKKQVKRGKDLGKIRTLIGLLVKGAPLAPRDIGTMRRRANGPGIGIVTLNPIGC